MTCLFAPCPSEFGEKPFAQYGFDRFITTVCSPPALVLCFFRSSALSRTIAVRRYGNPQISPQCIMLVLCAEQAALLQDRHDELHKVIKTDLHDRAADHEAVRRSCLEPLLNLIGYLLGRTDEAFSGVVTRRANWRSVRFSSLAIRLIQSVVLLKPSLPNSPRSGSGSSSGNWEKSKWSKNLPR